MCDKGRPVFRRTCLVLPFIALGFASVARAQGLDAVRAEYSKHEYLVPMRDGTKLFTSVYVPKQTQEKYPILLTRTPYSVRPYGDNAYKADLGPSPLFGKSGYIFVYQDVRGRWASEGEFVNMRPYIPNKRNSSDIDESSDTYDTIEWLLQNVPNHNGRVGMWGISYPGFYTDAGMIDAHPALVAASPQAPVTDWFVGDDWHHNGALFLPHIFNFMASFGRPRPKPVKDFSYRFDHGTVDGYQFFLNMGPLANADSKYFRGDVAFWTEAMQHGTYDQFWKDRNVRQHLKNIRPAVMTVGGWFDAENLFGALETYKQVEKFSPDATNTIVMGPWSHGGWSRGDGDSLGDVRFGSKTGSFYRESIEFPFFEQHLKGRDATKPPEAWMFETGSNQWRQLDAWPPRGTQQVSLYARGDGRLSMDPPSETDRNTSDEYTSDPMRPVPFIDKISIGMDPLYMVSDQRFASRRPDVLVYETEPLTQSMTIAGPIQADFVVSTSGTDSDWIVKVIDVYPENTPDPSPNPAGVRMGGYQQLVRGDVMRAKFRNSYETPEPLEPNAPTTLKFTLHDVMHTFQPGHRVMVQVQSSWFPLVDRNPQSFVDIYTAKDGDFKKATQRVFRSRDLPSRVTVSVVPQAASN
jgi:putative CocE/NonD family hydrolase